MKVARNFHYNKIIFVIFFFLSSLIFVLNINKNHFINYIPLVIKSNIYAIESFFTESVFINYEYHLYQQSLIKKLTHENNILNKHLSVNATKHLILEQLSEVNKSLSNNLNLKTDLTIDSFSTFSVVYKSNSLNYNLLIKLNSPNEVKINSLVLNSGYVVGYISNITKDYATITTIFDYDFKIAATTKTSKKNIVVKGNQSNYPDIVIYSNKEVLDNDDLVFTSGLEGLYKPYIKIGQIVTINDKYKIKLPFDFYSIQYVQVIN